MQHDDSVTFMEICPLLHENHVSSTVCRQSSSFVTFYPSPKHTHAYLSLHAQKSSYMSDYDLCYMWVELLCKVFSHSHSQSVCTKCPLHTQNTHANTQMQTHALECQRRTEHTHTHARKHMCNTHTLGCGKSLALAASYLRCKFASTGGCYNDNDAKIIWPVNITYDVPAARALNDLLSARKKKKKRWIKCRYKKWGVFKVWN